MDNNVIDNATKAAEFVSDLGNSFRNLVKAGKKFIAEVQDIVNDVEESYSTTDSNSEPKK